MPPSKWNSIMSSFFASTVSGSKDSPLAVTRIVSARATAARAAAVRRDLMDSILLLWEPGSLLFVDYGSDRMGGQKSNDVEPGIKKLQ